MTPRAMSAGAFRLLVDDENGFEFTDITEEIATNKMLWNVRTLEE